MDSFGQTSLIQVSKRRMTHCKNLNYSDKGHRTEFGSLLWATAQRLLYVLLATAQNLLTCCWAMVRKLLRRFRQLR
jgi:hypothetical protein